MASPLGPGGFSALGAVGLGGGIATAVVNVVANIAPLEAGLAAGVAETESQTAAMTAASEEAAAGASAAAAGIGVALAVVAGASVKMAAEFNFSMNQLISLVGESRKNVEGFKVDLLDMAQALGRSPVDLAKGLYFVESAGFRGAKALDLLRTSAKLSAVGLGSVQQNADALTSVLNAYANTNLTAAKAADILVEAETRGKIPIGALSAVLGNVVPVAAEAGVAFEDVAAGIAAVSRQGVPVARAATGFRYLLAELLSPSNQASKALNQVFGSTNQLANALASQGLLPVLTKLHDQLDRFEFIKAVGGVRSLQVALALVGNNSKQVAEIFREVAGASGSLNHAFAVTTGQLKFQAQQFVAGIEADMIRLGTALTPIGSLLLSIFGPALHVAFSALTLVAKGIEDILKLLSPLKVEIQAVAFAWLAWKGVTLGIDLITKGLIAVEAMLTKTATSAAVEGTAAAAATVETEALGAAATVTAGELAAMGAAATVAAGEVSAAEAAAAALGPATAPILLPGFRALPNPRGTGTTYRGPTGFVKESEATIAAVEAEGAAVAATTVETEAFAAAEGAAVAQTALFDTALLESTGQLSLFGIAVGGAEAETAALGTTIAAVEGETLGFFASLAAGARGALGFLKGLPGALVGVLGVARALTIAGAPLAVIVTALQHFRDYERVRPLTARQILSYPAPAIPGAGVPLAVQRRGPEPSQIYQATQEAQSRYLFGQAAAAYGGRGAFPAQAPVPPAFAGLRPRPPQPGGLPAGTSRDMAEAVRAAQAAQQILDHLKAAERIQEFNAAMSEMGRVAQTSGIDVNKSLDAIAQTAISDVPKAKEQFGDLAKSINDWYTKLVSQLAGNLNFVKASLAGLEPDPTKVQDLQVAQERLTAAQNRYNHAVNTGSHNLASYRASVESAKQRVADLQDQTSLSAGEIIKSFKDQLRAQIEFGNNLETIQRRSHGAATQLVTDLAAEGTQGQITARTIAQSHGKAFDSIVHLYARAQREASKYATNLAKDMVGSLRKIDQDLNTLIYTLTKGKLGSLPPPDTKAAESKVVDFARFMQLTLTQAGRVEINVSGLTPGPPPRGGGGRRRGGSGGGGRRVQQYGAWITEPVEGVGLLTGAGYTFGEKQAEWVGPKEPHHDSGRIDYDRLGKAVAKAMMRSGASPHGHPVHIDGYKAGYLINGRRRAIHDG